MPGNQSAYIHIQQVLNFSWDKIFVVYIQPTKTAKVFNLENFRLYSMCSLLLHCPFLTAPYNVVTPIYCRTGITVHGNFVKIVLTTEGGVEIVPEVESPSPLLKTVLRNM